ncbi:MAG: LysR family transcriptional regulator [Thiocapsa sp.]|jgi:LysR family cys regulon transcriptional activator|nr:LysR substrate-binding domain-containing protein [Thiocapsa sp.]MCG6897350.1 LysR family transcriptional regulator [Thiocapsa sp.]MCG6986417.1 LysR family transcriptional regulator [Thiocapsa sp.]
MELRQLRSFVTLVESDFNVSQAAERLHLVQPAVSQHLRQLEDELGVRLFRRRGKRLLGLNEVGDKVLAYARAALTATGNIAAVGKDHAQEQTGVLRVAATHTQARYVLPSVVRRFSAEYPGVALEIHQGTPAQLIDMVVRDGVDLAVCTEGLDPHPALLAVPCYRWNRCLVAPEGHPVLACKPLTLDVLCAYPVITYVFGFTGRGNMSDTFSREGLRPHVVLGAVDTDVIKTYVREGLGIGIIADMAYQPDHDADLARRDLSHLFPWEVTKIAHLRNKYLRGFQQRFIDVFQAETAGLGQVGRGPKTG